MTFFRWLASPPIAAIITLALFAMMAAMIRQPEVSLPAPIPYEDIDIRMKPEPEPIDPVEPTELPPETPPTVIETPTKDGPPDFIDFPEPTPVGPTVDGTTIQITKPVIKYPPQYPESCRSRQVEGVVRVQFDITPEGSVVNPRVIETPNRCFVRSVIATVSKWKYPPASGGRMRYGVIETFNFVLSD